MRCIICSCTDKDCSECIEVTGRACTWAAVIDNDASSTKGKVGLCSACVEIAHAERQRRLSLTKEVRAQRQREDKRRAR